MGWQSSCYLSCHALDQSHPPTWHVYQESAACRDGEADRYAHVLGESARYPRSPEDDEGLGIRSVAGLRLQWWHPAPQGSLLLNRGPSARGTIPQPQKAPPP